MFIVSNSQGKVHARKRLSCSLATSESEDEMEGRLLLNVVVRKGSAILKLLTSEDESLLVWGDALLILDLGLDVLDGVSGLNVEGDRLTGKGLDENLHTTSKSENKMESRLLLDVVIRESSAVLELLTSEDKSLLVWGNTLLILDLGLDVLNGVCGLNIKSDGLTSQSLDEDLHTTSESQDEMESGLLLDVIVGEGSTVLELLTGEDKSLLIGWDTFLILDLSLDIFNGVCWLNVEGDGLAGEGLDEDLHTTSESEDEMESGLLLDVVVGEGSAVFELLASEDKTLLIGRDALLILDLSLHVVNGVGWLDLESDGLASQSLNENLHDFDLLVAVGFVFFF